MNNYPTTRDLILGLILSLILILVSVIGIVYADYWTAALANFLGLPTEGIVYRYIGAALLSVLVIMHLRDFRTLKQEVSTLEQEVNALEQEVNALKQEVSTLELEVAGLTDRIDDLEYGDDYDEP